MAEIKVKGQMSCEIWQSLKKDLNAYGFVNIIRRKLIFGRMTEVHKGYIQGNKHTLCATVIVKCNVCP